MILITKIIIYLVVTNREGHRAKISARKKPSGFDQTGQIAIRMLFPGQKEGFKIKLFGPDSWPTNEIKIETCVFNFQP
jgi:hypothetical protein